MQASSYPYFRFKEGLRQKLRGLLMTMGLCAGLAIAIAAPPSGYGDDFLRPLFVGIVFGVPGGLILYPLYRLLRFALNR